LESGIEKGREQVSKRLGKWGRKEERAGQQEAGKVG